MTALATPCRHLKPTRQIILYHRPEWPHSFELAFRIDLMVARATGRYLRPGEPHLQCDSPAKWRRIIESANLRIVAHRMAIGFFVNTLNALVQLPTVIARAHLTRGWSAE